MKGLSYTTDLLIAGIILIGVVMLVVYAEGFLRSDWEDVYRLKLIASDASYYLSKNIGVLDGRSSCEGALSQVIPASLNYQVELNGRVVCSRGDISKATKVASSIAYGAYEERQLDPNQESYYYKTCKATKEGSPAYRCNINSYYERSEIERPSANNIVREGVIVVRVFV